MIYIAVMFSFKDEGSIKPVAKIIGNKDGKHGKLVGKYVYLHRKPEKGHKIPQNYFFTELELPYGLQFEWVPDNRDAQSDVICLASPRGSGKSTLASKYAQTMKKLFDLKDDDVIVVKKSRLDDPAYDKLNPTYLYIDDEFIDQKLTCDDISPDGSIKVIILDDLDIINSKTLKKAVVDFTNDLLQNGRKYNIYVILAMHTLCNGRETKPTINESTYIVFFPDNCTSDMRYALQKYADMSTNCIRQLKKIESRAVMFHQVSPRFLLSDNTIEMYDLDKFEDKAKEEKELKKLEKIERSNY
jgi:hypothetical protein